MVCSKFKSPLRILGRYEEGQKDCEDILVNKVDVNEEYKEAFRTTSFTEICSKVQDHLASKSMQIPSNSVPLYLHLFGPFLEPGQGTLAHRMNEGFSVHPLLIDYFKITIEACNLCEILLQSIHQIRVNNSIIKAILNLRQKALDSTFSNIEQCHAMFQDLALFANIKNPISAMSLVEFHRMHISHTAFLHRLTIRCTEIQRRIKIKRCLKKMVGCTNIMAYARLTFTLIALTFHSIVKFVAAPAWFTCSFGFPKKQNKLVMIKASSGERIAAQLDVAAKGLYILINDFNTMSRLVMRLDDEIEHNKAMAYLCSRNGNIEVLKAVVREFRIEESCFNERLDELEEHIYLCFLTINRSKGLVMHELMHGATRTNM
ncbi:Single hybrid motif superfamily protein [Heracleum sosnowskyi]|uniref:Single hybrid motif superfamily protein n=1 Tax=Heracleum sosnowskyi TaxID=360622 RepID=A0AAD8HA28_9APIA|nr:Single hybrid motif superfamily protein [Heracleum sosnowskyi]